jgi:hypothetical protein
MADTGPLGLTETVAICANLFTDSKAIT